MVCKLLTSITWGIFQKIKTALKSGLAVVIKFWLIKKNSFRDKGRGGGESMDGGGEGGRQAGLTG